VNADPALAYLLGRVSVVESRVRELVEQRRQDDPQPDDPFRGLYLSEEAIDRLLASPPAVPELDSHDDRLQACESFADDLLASGGRVRLRELASRFTLSPLDVELLLVAMAGDIDPRFEQLFGYLNDDVTRRRPSVGVAFALCGVALTSAQARARLLGGPLVTKGLLDVADPDRPFPGRALRVPDRVVGHLLGDDDPDPALLGVLGQLEVVDWGDPVPLATALGGGVTFAYLREPPTGSGRVLASRALDRCGLVTVVLDLGRLAGHPDAVAIGRTAAREARLTGAGLIAGPVDVLGTAPDLLASLRADPMPLLLVGSGAWDPAWSDTVPLLVDVAGSTSAERAGLWNASLNGSAPGLDPGKLTEQFLLRPEQVGRAAGSALTQAAMADGARMTAEHVRAGARAENGSALQRLSRRVEPAVGWEDLVLPPATLTALREVAVRARHRERVLGDWGMRPGGGRGYGVCALFAGDSGTGKTMSAEVVAGSLGLDLYVVDLATVVDKYVGETEKNLERIFTAAAGVNGVLLFDEADAVFGKRSEVRDAHDRYANVESAYLLQRMETFDGLAILATNLRANIDEAFTRRLDVVVDFPLPDAEHRLALWRRCLAGELPSAADLDLDFCAAAFELAGGSIRSAAITAAYLAADSGGQVEMSHLVTAVQREYRKLGRLCLEHEFGRYYSLLT
jgi:hypothetical protein